MSSKRPSNRFSGPFLAIPRWVLQYLNNDGTTALVLMHLCCYLDADQNVWASYNTLAKNSGLSRSTVIRAIQKLCEMGVLIKTKRATDGRNIPNSYSMNFNNPSTFNLPSGVTSDTTPMVSRLTPPSVTHDTTGSSTRDTPNKSKEQEEKNKKGFERIDSRLL